MKHRLAVLACLSALSACGPVYQTEYVLTPPSSPSGKQCANQCYYVRQGCTIACAGVQDGCYGPSVSLGVGVGHHHGWGGHRYSPWHGHGYYDDDYEYQCRYQAEACAMRCEADYRACFAACGGGVQPVTTCVSNCPPQ